MELSRGIYGQRVAGEGLIGLVRAFSDQFIGAQWQAAVLFGKEPTTGRALVAGACTALVSRLYEHHHRGLEISTSPERVVFVEGFFV